METIWKELAEKRKEIVAFIFNKTTHPNMVERKKYCSAIQRIVDRKGLLTIESIEAEAANETAKPVMIGKKS